jgi:hypothetical protein
MHVRVEEEIYVHSHAHHRRCFDVDQPGQYVYAQQLMIGITKLPWSESKAPMLRRMRSGLLLFYSREHMICKCFFK